MFLDFAKWVASTSASTDVQSILWLTPLLQSIHILMIGVVVVVILMLTLRVLGYVATEETFEAVWKRYTPWMWGAIVVMALTGIVLSIGEPVREASAMSFWVKMALIVIGIASALAWHNALRPVTSVGTAGFSGGAKLVAIATIVLWLFVIFLGRSIAYDKEVWESLHLG